MSTASLVSTPYLAIALVAVLALSLFTGRLRELVFLGLNVLFLGAVVFGPTQIYPAILFCVTGYLLLQLVLRQPRWGFQVALGVYVALFIYVMDYDFLHWALPEWSLRAGILATVGLSFMFFKVIHTMVEARSGTLGAVRPLQYMNYCLNFSVYLMGPIQRYQDYRAQWTDETKAIPETFEAHLDAVLRILIGFMKAYVIAGMIQPFALAPSPELLELGRAELLGQVVAFYFFLYFNFAGYCDVAIGVGSLLGVRPPENFNMPFLARNISDFWLRFHRSLTQWLTTYVFSPAYKWALGHPMLRGRPLLAANSALLLTMLVSGLWHGTTLSFLLFGLAHGLFFLVFRTWEALATRRFGVPWLRQWRARPLVHAASVLVTFTGVALSLIFFRLEAADAVAVLARLVGA